MSDLPLQPLVWGVDEYTGEPASNSLLHGYIVMNDGNGKFKVAYYLLSGGTYTKFATGFATIDEAKAWAWNHYNEKMQPYVKSMPTWIDVNEREPTEKGDYLIRDYQGRVAMGKYDKGFYMESGGEKWGCVQFWMPTPEFSTMQNLHKGGDCD